MVFLFPLLAQASALRSLRFQHVSLEQGLPMQSVQTIAQDPQGFLWMGGQAGLVRFDGYRFTSYKNTADDIHSLNSDWVRQIYFDRQARMWIITAAGGLHLYDRNRDHFQRFVIPGDAHSQVQNSAINDIIDDGQQGLWLATENGLAHFIPATGKIRWWHHQAGQAQSLAHERVNTMALDRRGQLWLATENGLDLLAADGNSFVHHQVDSRPDADKKNNAVNKVLIDAQGNFCLGMRRGMLSWMQGRPWDERSKVSLPEKIQQASIKELYQDQAGQIWIIPHAQGVLRWNPVTNNMQHFLHEAGDSSSLADDQVEAVFQDRSGILWLGYWTSGASHVDLLGPAFWRYVAGGQPGSLSNPKVTAIAEAAPGQLMLGSFGGGLNVLDLATGIASDGNSAYGLNGKTVLSMYPRQKDQVWVATETGIYSVDLHARKAQPRAVQAGEPPTHQLQNITVDHHGIFWSANTRGLLRLDPASNQLSIFRHSSTDASSIAHDGVMAVLEDSQARLWVGTLEGLDLLDQASMTFRHYRHDPKDAASLGSSFVTFLFEDSQKNLWLGTSAGLSKMQVKQTGQIGFDNYATNSAVDCIMEDQAGKLWLSTDAGIARFDPASQQFRYFTGKDGLIDGGYYSSSCFRDTQQTMYFGGLTGMSAFQPANIRENTIPPPVLITGLQIFNQPQAAGKTAEGFSLQGQIQDSKSISLSYTHTVFSLEFAALHFADPQANRYAYQLQGFDKEWVYTDASRRFATYTNLDPGEYLFRVKAANKDGIWNETGAQLRITITPPYWKTWWFRVLLACILFAILWMTYHYRLQQLLQQKKQLEVEVDKRTAEIAKQKQEIESKTDELEKTVGVLALANKLQLEHQSELTRFLAVASHDLRQPMHALNLYLEALSLEELSGSSQGLLSKLKKCAGTMDGMFLSLLDLSRLDARIVEPNVTEFPLAQLLKKIELEFAPQAQEKSLYFRVAETQAWVKSDSDLLEQILRNLVANAIRYTHSGGIELSFAEVRQHLNLIISDTGIGISVHQQASIFQEFFQAGVHRRDSTKGLGLGLAIVKRLTNLLSIPMVLHSELGQGTQFSLLLTRAHMQAEVVVPFHDEREHASQLSGKRIVIIDDDDAILHATQSCLLQWHCEVTVGHSSAEVIHKIADDMRIPDIIICDYHLGGNENGLEAIANLRDMFNHDIPALIITGDMQVEEQLKNTGDAMPILYKPVSIGFLQKALVQLGLAQCSAPKADDEFFD
ncbi:two-component regulator propeller domain-containing protein [Undibacterium sp. Di27W]|uniref:hybrid sensor histidine kinase/response regulator n=1 Tax=Undibacterium sp. Di27W TaxID=3413036 RepID=UPI003BF2A06E